MGDLCLDSYYCLTFFELPREHLIPLLKILSGALGPARTSPSRPYCCLELFTLTRAHVCVSLAQESVSSLIVDLEPVTLDDFSVPDASKPAQILSNRIVV